MTDDAVIACTEGRAGRLTLNRPKALNALTYEMVLAIGASLNAWEDDPAVELIVIDGTGERAFCAGGDVLSLYDSRSDGPEFSRRFWADEYRLNARIARYPKPIVAIMDGIVMGGGIGLSAHASHRIVTERSMLAMPETWIGLIPDVGGTWLLARSPGNSGIYLGLTGARMKAADAIFAGFADTFVAGEQRAALTSALVETSAAQLAGVITRFAGEPPVSELRTCAPEIDQAFAATTVEGIIENLGRSGGAFASKATSDLTTRSPIALKVSLAAIRGARRLQSLDAALDVEYRLVNRLFQSGEFIEGIRALLVDKDKSPKWRPPTLAEVSQADVEGMLAPFPPELELGLA